MTCKGAYLVFVELVYPKKMTELNRRGSALSLMSCEHAFWREGIVTVWVSLEHFRAVTITHLTPTVMEYRLQVIPSRK